MGKRTKEDQITLGSGKAYIMEYSGTIPEENVICVEDNLLGKIKGGASLAYTVTTHRETDDLNTVAKTVVTDEEAALKLGMITFNGNTIAKLVNRCSVEDKDGIRTVLIGGSGNDQDKQWVVCFHHHDAKSGDSWVTILGNNESGLTLTYALDSATKLEPEFKCMAQDAKGTLVRYREEIDTAAAAE